MSSITAHLAEVIQLLTTSLAGKGTHDEIKAARKLAQQFLDKLKPGDLDEIAKTAEIDYATAVALVKEISRAAHPTVKDSPNKYHYAANEGDGRIATMCKKADAWLIVTDPVFKKSMLEALDYADQMPTLWKTNTQDPAEQHRIMHEALTITSTFVAAAKVKWKAKEPLPPIPLNFSYVKSKRLLLFSLIQDTK